MNQNQRRLGPRQGSDGLQSQQSQRQSLVMQQQQQGQGGEDGYYDDEPATVTAAVTNAGFAQPGGYDSYRQGGFDDDDASEGSDESGLGHTRLFVMIEEGMPRPNENRPLTVAEANQRRELVEQTWERIRKWLWAHQDPAEREAAATVRGNNDATPLHNVCKLTNPPADIVQALLEVAPETVTWADSHGWLPLHHACANGASGDVLQILTEAYPEGKTKQDSQNRTPLHFYLTQRAEYNNSTVMATNIMQFLSNSGAAELPDVGGMLPMHYACAYGVSPAVLAVLQEAYPDSLIAKENKGRTPVHLAMVNAHRDASPGVIDFLLEHSGNRSELVNLRDHDGYLPLHLLALGLKGFKADEPNQRNNVAECLKMYLGAEPRASADFLTALQDLPDWLQDVAVVSSHVRSILNKKIVQRFPTAVLMMDGYCLLLIIIFFEIATTANIDARFEQKETESILPVVILFVGGTYFLLRELVQIISLWYLGSFSSWFYDATNWLDMAVIILVYYYSILMTNPDFGVSDEMFRSGCAFTKGILWCAVIYFLKSTLVDFAVFVGGVYYVLQRLAAFLMAVGVILLAFAQMFFIVYTETDICNKDSELNKNITAAAANIGDESDGCEFPHCTFDSSLLKVYTMMMGEIGDETRYDTSLVAQILYVAYAFLVVILLSNVLIAIVTDSYEIIQNDRAAIVFWSNRLDFVAETDAVSYGFLQRIKLLGGDRAGGSPSEAQEGPYSTHAADAAVINNKPGTKYFYHGWKSIVQLFDQNLYDDIALSPQNIEFWCYFLFQAAAVLFVIPIWIVAGLVTAGVLWPPQIREYLFVQKETTISRADLEKSKLEQLKEIQTSVKTLKVDLKREMLADREEMTRMKSEVEAIQNDVMSDLQQVRELMTTLLDMGRQRSGR